MPTELDDVLRLFPAERIRAITIVNRETGKAELWHVPERTYHGLKLAAIKASIRALADRTIARHKLRTEQIIADVFGQGT